MSRLSLAWRKKFRVVVAVNKGRNTTCLCWAYVVSSPNFVPNASRASNADQSSILRYSHAHVHRGWDTRSRGTTVTLGKSGEEVYSMAVRSKTARDE